MKKIYRQCLAAMFLLMAFLLIMNGARRKEEALAAEIAPGVLRFHVLANSDSPEDQELKLKVNDFLLELLRPHATSKQDTQDYIIQNRAVLEAAADSFLKSLGSEQTTRICLETCAFPRRTYGDTIFPAGTYDAVRVLIGDGDGKNFWCVLYPSLCYPESAYNKNTEQDISLPRVAFRMKFFEWLPI